MTARDAGRCGDGLPLVVVLHARGGDAAAGLALARRLFGDGPDVLAAQAARPCNPFQSNLQASRAYAGFSWYLGDDPSQPEAASFGDALAQVDALLRDLDRAVVVAGEGQGAVLARTLARYAAPGLAGVLAPGAAMPRIEGWTPPAARTDGVGVLLEEPVDPVAWLHSLANPSRSGAHA